MLKWGFSVVRFVKDMADDSTNSDPPQIAYQVGFALAMLLLAITMVRYPLW